MCGFAGYITPSGGLNHSELSEQVRLMSFQLAHRGPDDDGVWVHSEMSLALSHRRLAIQDLSIAGHQPMQSQSGRYVIVFNGEIYNHLELRSKLNCDNWIGLSDTETILVAIEEMGIQKALELFVGMFSFAVWDNIAKELTLVRDRFGEKPLYYGWQDGTFLFSSELKAMTVHKSFKKQIDRNSLTLFMRYGYIPVPHTIWSGIHKLLPGSILVMGSNELCKRKYPIPIHYWQASEVKVPYCNEVNELEAINQLDFLLHKSIKGQMIADVQIGAFLSGGIDSSTVAAIMQNNSNMPIKTFSIGFEDDNYNEAKYAKAIANHLGTDHTEYYVTPDVALTIIPKLPYIYDEPFADSSQIPTHIVSALARNDVAVSLSGDGGDEIFGGYNRYVLGASIWRNLSSLPIAIRKLASHLFLFPTSSVWDSVNNILPTRLQINSLGERVHKLASVIDAKDPQELYLRLISLQANPADVVIGGIEPEIWANSETQSFIENSENDSLINRMMFHDLVGYMTDDILVKVDRAAMSVGLETRVPMLDHRIVEFSWSLPNNVKIRNGEGKWILRQVLYRYVPKKMVERPKQGFGLPLAQWLRGPLREWASALLDESRIRNEGFLNSEIINRRWQEHLSGRKNWQYWLWNILMFQAWYECWIEGDC